MAERVKILGKKEVAEVVAGCVGDSVCPDKKYSFYPKHGGKS